MLNVTRFFTTVLVAVFTTPMLLAAQAVPIDTMAIRAHTRLLAHDSLGGRGTGSIGESIAARYIVRQCAALGLEPLGDDYLLPFDLIASEIDPANSTLLISGGGVEQTFQTPTDFFPNVGRYAVSTRITGPAVFVGDVDQFLDTTRASEETEGAIAVTLGVPRGPVLLRLADRGFIAAIHVPANQSTFDRIKRSRGFRRWAHADAGVTSSFLPPIPTIVIGANALRALTRGAKGTGPEDIVLNSLVDLQVSAVITQFTVNNIGCLRPGVDRETITAFSAHYDHLGISTPNAAGDSIYNGFSDNAAGVAMLLAIAATTKQAQPQNDLAFLFFTAEERGLLGSDAFVHDPPVPLDRFRAVINLDAGAPPGAPTTWRIAGDETALRAAAVAAGEMRGWTVTTTGPTPNTDYYPFYRVGIPAVFVVPGTGPYEGMDQGQSDSLKNRWDGYHQAHDHWYPDFPFSGLERYARYAIAIGEAYRR